MTAVMIGNALIELGWIGATVYLVIHGHPVWAGATFIAALASGYSWKTKEAA